PNASLVIKGKNIGSSTNDKAKFSINVDPGNYTVICQRIGYVAIIKKVVVTKNDQEISFTLKRQPLNYTKTVVNSAKSDPAVGIIRKAIKKRSYYERQIKILQYDLYTRNTINLRHVPPRVPGQIITEKDTKKYGLDTSGLGIIYLSESVQKVAAKQSGLKIEIEGSRVAGENGFGFNFSPVIDFYQNNVTVFEDKLNPRGFISPLADGAFRYYKYKLLGTFIEDGKEISTIYISPRRKYEPLFSGIINVTNDYQLHSLDLLLTPKYTLELLDTLLITQQYVPVNAAAWRIKDQFLHFNFKKFGIDAIGNFVNVYSRYKIDPTLSNDFFNNVVIKYDTGVSKKPLQYWNTIRPVPLEKEEVINYQIKDSLYDIDKDFALSKKRLHALKKKQGPILLYDVFWKGINRNNYDQENSFNWSSEPLLRKVEYNTVEGFVLGANVQLNKYLKKYQSTISVQPNFRYGINNRHFNTWVNVDLITRNFEADRKVRPKVLSFSAGKKINQFNKESAILPQINSLSTLVFGNNYMKIYENYFASVGFSKRYESGIKFSIATSYEDRIPLDNTTDFTLFKKDTLNITPNYPELGYGAVSGQFTRHQAFITSMDVSITPGQKYIQYPGGKVFLTSKYPTFSLNYTKGINGIFGSDVDFDKWKFVVKGDLNLKLSGAFRYKLSAGGFLNTSKVFIQDYTHFNGNLSLGAGEYLNSFQLSKYYIYSNMASLYGEAHIEHHLNGFFTNKIPLFNRLNWKLVLGSNAFYINNDKNYVEVFAGLENIFSILRLDFVKGYEEGNIQFTGLRLGAEGLLGKDLNPNSRDRNKPLGF
ncbi:MAG: carboxypeptidase-like regulatory domain-containing protein, partial [Sphingobacteriales bacterium]|nr:carboxypeptidase-like regulatory domain-containing protein [Sphingobacteriales bacterium]